VNLSKTLVSATWSQTDVLIADLTDGIARFAHAALSSPAEMFAIASVIVAGGLVLVSSFVKTMIPLRWLAIGSNFGFIAYGAAHPSMPMLLLHSILVPINVYRLVEMVRLTRHVRAAEAADDLLGIWLRPYMRSTALPDGALLFRKGDIGDRIYLLVEGMIEMVEIGVSVKAGEIFGEIAVFAPDRQRRATARCVGECTVLSIDDITLKQLCYQNPGFGFKVIGLVAGRLSADVQRLADQLHGQNSV
jgi:CRP/FNR family transcriptional regulator, cyclic AMP receptor protein